MRSRTVSVLASLFLVSFAAPSLGVEQATFLSAKPIWPAAWEKEKNLLVGFRAIFDAPAEGQTLLRVTASSVYRVWINGEFLGYGPARGPHSYFRIDEWSLAGRFQPGKNVLAIEVAGYNVNSYYLLDQPSFLQAEVAADGKVLASTAGDGSSFVAGILTERVQRVERYSFQRTFTEVYRLRPGYDDWRGDAAAKLEPVTCSVQPAGNLLPRRVPYPDFAERQPVAVVYEGTVRRGVTPDRIWRSRGLREIGPKLGGYPEEELEWIPSHELQRLAIATSRRADRALTEPAKFTIAPNSYRIFDFGTNLTGFLGAHVTCPEQTRLHLVFDEILTGEDVDFKRLSAVNTVAYELAPGSYRFETIEPYTLRYLKLLVTDGECRTENIYLREYANSNVYRAHFVSSDERLNRLFDAGRETFRQNAVDIFMDCPSRERAGWLCDSYFTARVAPRLSGETSIERNFFENYLLPDQFAFLPESMLPMCYPADHYNGTFIPNWSLWFVLELQEYLARSGDRKTVDALRPKIMRLFRYFRQFRNEDGLLEKLPSWVFIEWSAANKFVQDVNYPSNMLYAAALESAGRMYGEPELVAEARRVRDAVREQSFDGEFFVDNAVRKDDKLQATRNRTEVCQYFAFFFDVATPDSHQALWKVLRDRFGPDRKQRGAYPDIHPANAFVGNMLRLELLSRFGRTQQLLDESISYLLYMADRTGTLWENVDPSASCNHGFASHIVHTLYRDVLGLYSIDPTERLVKLRFSDLNLQWVEGEVPGRDGRVSLRWRKGDGAKILYRVDVPAGYTIKVENLSGAEAVPDR